MLGAAEAALTDMGRRLVRGIWYRPLHVVITNRGVHVAQSTVYANIPGHFGGQIAQVVRAAQYAGMSTLWHSHTHTVQLPQTAAATQTDWEDPEVMQGTMTQEEREKALAKAAKAEKEKEKEKGSRRKKKRGRLGGIRKMIVSRKVLSGKKKSNRFPGNAVH